MRGVDNSRGRPAWSRGAIPDIFGFDDLIRAMDVVSAMAPLGNMIEAQQMSIPPVEVRETDHSYILCLDVPGMRKEDLEVEVNGNRLVIRGERREELETGGRQNQQMQDQQMQDQQMQDQQMRDRQDRDQQMPSRSKQSSRALQTSQNRALQRGGQPFFSEITYGEFQRVFTLPENADTSNVGANYENGVLRIEVAKTAQSRPQKVAVQASRTAEGRIDAQQQGQRDIEVQESGTASSGSRTPNGGASQSKQQNAPAS